MRVVVTGSKGLLGTCLTKHLKANGVSVIEADIPEYNIISYISIKKIFNSDYPIDFLINCAAFTDVPRAEIDKKSAYFVNSQACGVLAKACSENNTHLIHFSTDFVFDGLKFKPYEENDKPHPLNYYGQSKLDGERILKRNTDNFTIFRLQWLFGDSNKTFFSKILEKSKTENKLQIVTDEVGAPCSVDFVSSTIIKYLHSKINNGNTYHLTHNNHCTRYECAQYFLDKIGWRGKLIPVNSSIFPSTLVRPKFGVMSNSKLSEFLQFDLGTWEEDVDLFIKKNLC